MSITFFGVIWILICTYFLLFKSFKKNFLLLCFSSVFQANSILEKNTMYPIVATCLFFILKFCIEVFIKKKKINLSLSFFFPLFFFFLVFLNSVMSSLVARGTVILAGDNNPYYTIYNGELGIYRFISLLLLCIALSISIICFSNNLLSLDNSFFKNYSLIVLFVILFGFLQFSMNLFGYSPSQLFLNLFYSNKEANYFTTSTPFTRMCSTFQEASYCSLFMVSNFWLFASTKCIKKRKSIFFMLLLGICSIMTFSSTALVMFFIGLFIYTLTMENHLRKFFIVIIGTFTIVVFAVFGLPDFLSELTLAKLKSDDGQMRNLWNQAAFSTFLQSPLIGVGYTNIRASSLIYNLLGQLGIFGAIYFFAFLVLPIFFNHIKKTNESVLLLVSCVLIGEIVACPDIDNCVLWLSFFLSSSCFLKKKTCFSSSQKVKRLAYYD